MPIASPNLSISRIKNKVLTKQPEATHVSEEKTWEISFVIPKERENLLTF